MSTKVKKVGKHTGVAAAIASSVYGVLTLIDPVLALQVGSFIGTVSKSVGLCS